MGIVPVNHKMYTECVARRLERDLASAMKLKPGLALVTQIGDSPLADMIWVVRLSGADSTTVELVAKFPVLPGGVSCRQAILDFVGPEKWKEICDG